MRRAMRRARLVAELAISLLLVVLAFPLLVYVMYHAGFNIMVFVASCMTSIFALGIGIQLLLKRLGYVVTAIALVIATLILVALISGY
jgi:hypothetical protein